MPKLQCVLSHYCTSFHETIYKGTNTCAVYFSYLQFLSSYLFTSHHLILVLLFISLILSSVYLFVPLLFASFFLYYSLTNFSHLCISVYHTFPYCHFSYSHTLHSIIWTTSTREYCMVKLTKSNLQQK